MDTSTLRVVLETTTTRRHAERRPEWTAQGTDRVYDGLPPGGRP